jgi:hypothetical protein
MGFLCPVAFSAVGITVTVLGAGGIMDKYPGYTVKGCPVFSRTLYFACMPLVHSVL